MDHRPFDCMPAEQEEDEEEEEEEEEEGSTGAQVSPGSLSDPAYSTASSSLASVVLEKDRMIDTLQGQLVKAQAELAACSEKYAKLKSMQQSVDGEIHELTASLFQEAYRIATDAHEKRSFAEKLFREASNKVDVLQAEVKALKAVSCTGSFRFTPSYNPVKLLRTLRLADGRRLPNARPAPEEPSSALKELIEVDPILHREFVGWRETSSDTSNLDHPFIKRLLVEDIDPCLTFSNAELSRKLSASILDNTIMLEEICSSEASQSKICSLSQVPRECRYRMKICNNSDEWLFVSSFCRNRIAAVCDLFTYLRYLSRGLLRHGTYDSYVEVVQLRRNVTMARLGIKCSSEFAVPD